MKLFYDTLIPFMPDKDMNEKGELVPNKKREAARNAMIELANFQKSGTPISLYNSILFACAYAEKDLVDEILNIPETLEVPEVSIGKAVDICARMLFESIKPDATFDLDKFVGILLSTGHCLVEALNEEQAKSSADSEETKPIPDDTPELTDSPTD